MCFLENNRTHDFLNFDQGTKRQIANIEPIATVHFPMKTNVGFLIAHNPKPARIIAAISIIFTLGLLMVFQSNLPTIHSGSPIFFSRALNLGF